MTTASKNTDQDSLFQRFLADLGPKMRALKALEGKKHKRFAKGIERFLGGGTNNPGTILSLVAATVQLPDLETIVGTTAEGKRVTLSDCRVDLLDMWQKLGFITTQEIESREEGD